VEDQPGLLAGMALEPRDAQRIKAGIRGLSVSA
jgi:hypothetical protein